jgi:hypothetical protein
VLWITRPLGRVVSYPLLSVASMFKIELPTPDEVAELDDVGLLHVMAVAEGLESAAKESRLAGIQELYGRRARAAAQKKAKAKEESSLTHCPPMSRHTSARYPVWQ